MADFNCDAVIHLNISGPAGGPPTRTIRVFFQQSGAPFGWQHRTNTQLIRLFPSPSSSDMEITD